jgi:hypothetical protein
MSGMIPWRTPPAPQQKPEPRPTWRDLWDALFGRRLTFYCVELDGSWFICSAAELVDFDVADKSYVHPDGWCVTAPGGDHYTITKVRMTRRQYDALPEFQGF